MGPWNHALYVGVEVLPREWAIIFLDNLVWSIDVKSECDVGKTSYDVIWDKLRLCQFQCGEVPMRCTVPLPDHWRFFFSRFSGEGLAHIFNTRLPQLLLSFDLNHAFILQLRQLKDTSLLSSVSTVCGTVK